MSRESILNRIKQNKPSEVDLPQSVDYGIVYENSLEQFQTSLKAVAAETFHFSSQAQFEEHFEELYPDKPMTYSQIKSLQSFESERPHDYRDLDLAIYQSQLGVAENGAIFINFQNESQRSQAFLAVNLCLILKQSDIVDNMHLAYQKLSTMPNYGVFISGPSKTADIEQCLVIGAHGACTLKVIILEN